METIYYIAMHLPIPQKHIKYTVNDLFSAQCPKERLVLVNILVEKSSPFSAPHHADQCFSTEVVKAIFTEPSIYYSLCMCVVWKSCVNKS